MTLKEKIQLLHSKGWTQQKIDQATGITQSSVSRILKGTQQSVQYEKGKALDSLVAEMSTEPSSAVSTT